MGHSIGACFGVLPSVPLPADLSLRRARCLLLRDGARAGPDRTWAQAEDPVSRVTQLNREALAGGRQARVREGARAAEARAGHVQGRRSRTAPGRRRGRTFTWASSSSRGSRARTRARSSSRRRWRSIRTSRSRSRCRRRISRKRSPRPRGGAAARWPAVAGDEPAGAPRPPPRGPATAPRRQATAVAHRRAVVVGFSYHTVSEVKQGSSIIVTVTVEESLKFSKLVLAYREQGTSEFLGREMEPVGDGAYRRRDPRVGDQPARRSPTTWKRRTTAATRSPRAGRRRGRW